MDKRTVSANRVTIIGLSLNIVLVLFKLLAGIFGRSRAMVADGVHTLSDLATDIVVLLGFKLASKPKDKGHDYGHGKIETLAAIIIGLALLAIGLEIIWTGIQAVISAVRGYTIRQPGWIAFYAAIISIVSKEWLYRYTVKTGKDIKSDAVIANAWHHRSDALSSIGTMVGIGGAILLGEKWRLLDPVAAIIVSFFIIKVAISIFLGSANELIEASLSEEEENKILGIVRSVPGVKNPHQLRTRRIGNKIAIEIHIEVDKSLDLVGAHDISTDVEKRLKALFGNGTFISVHIEPLV